MQMADNAQHPTAGLQHDKHAAGRHETRGRFAEQAFWFGLPIAAKCPHIRNSQT